MKIGRTKRNVLSCKHALHICSTCKCVINILFCTHVLPCAPHMNAPQDILSCAYALLLYFTCEHSIIHILYFTHTLRLYNLRRTLLTSKLILWYCRRAVCTRIWDHTKLCTIQYISSRYLRIAYGFDPSIMSSETPVFTTYTLISASLWTSKEPLPWWICLPFAEECQPWRVWCHWLFHNDALKKWYFTPRCFVR